MIDEYQEAMELINAMQNCLPIPVYPSKALILLLKEKNLKIKAHQRLDIIGVHYLGDEGGISCSLKFPFKTEEVYVVSLTHLRLMPNHPLAKNIRRYQIQRIRNLAQQ